MSNSEYCNEIDMRIRSDELIEYDDHIAGDLLVNGSEYQQFQCFTIPLDDELFVALSIYRKCPVITYGVGMLPMIRSKVVLMGGDM